LCVECGKLPALGKSLCNSCSNKRSGRKKEIRSRRLSDGLCVKCGKISVLGTVSCNSCSNKNSERKKEIRSRRLSDGLCVRCGKNYPENCKSSCDNCIKQKYEQSIILKEKRLEIDMCTQCGKKSACEGKKRCKLCIFKNICRKATGSTRNSKHLAKKIQDQNFTCPYTGIKLIVGVNASLDHIVPKSKGGSNNVENLEWIDLNVNLLKGARTKDDFMEIWKFLVKSGARHLYETVID
jgi:hypothetical protein